jgi:hypothetical protein
VAELLWCAGRDDDSFIVEQADQGLPLFVVKVVTSGMGDPEVTSLEARAAGAW